MIETKSQHNLSLGNKKIPSWQVDVLILGLWYCIYFLFMLGSRHLSIPDEGRYPEIAREMLTSGNWITPTINGVPFLDKPILYYWLEALSMKCFGVNPWAIRLPQALFGIIGCLSLYGFARVLYSRSVALLASLILSVSLLYFFAAHYANMDLIVANLLWISFFFFICALRIPYPSYKRRLLMYLVYIIAGLAFLTKGLMGVVFPAMVIIIWVLLTKKWRQLLKIYLPTGILLFALVVVPWFYLVQKENPDFLYYFFYYQQVHRFVGSGFNNQLGPWFYFVIVLAAFLPFSLMLLHRLLPGLKSIWSNRFRDDTTLLIQLWVVLIFIFFSIPSSKIVGYILPIIAPLALLIALSFEAMINVGIIRKSTKVMHTLASMIFLVIAIGALIYPLIQKEFSTSLLYISFIPAAIGALGVFLSLFYSFKNQLKKALYIIVVSMIIFNASVLTTIPIFDKKTSQPLVNIIKPYIHKNTVFVSYEDYWEDLPLLLQHHVYVVYPWKQRNEFESDNWAREFYFGIQQYQKTHHSKWPKYLITEEDFAKLWFSSKNIFVFMDQSKLKQFKYYFSNEKTAIKVYGRYRNVFVVGKIIKPSP
ncbi:MAG: phospholipid carrier-dependent glycosyltransferase [Gammaproteobacteria bacterium]|nr:MAG: phospholipid carrier-dependent glycosyltransferase [Gammaproteobacteria bacterium]UTW42771.1 glycosyltransferase family 39 protein [bacterium SCSIO 12844]